MGGMMEWCEVEVGGRWEGGEPSRIALMREGGGSERGRMGRKEGGREGGWVTEICSDPGRLMLGDKTDQCFGCPAGDCWWCSGMTRSQLTTRMPSRP